MTTRTYTVEGMSCGHCVKAITAEINKINDVTNVKVDLAAKTVTVTGERVDDDAVRAAVDEAGYAVVG